MKLHWSKEPDGQEWGHIFPIFNIFKDGRKLFLAYIPRPRGRNGKNPTRFMPINSIQQGKRIAKRIIDSGGMGE